MNSSCSTVELLIRFIQAIATDGEEIYMILHKYISSFTIHSVSYKIIFFLGEIFSRYTYIWLALDAVQQPVQGVTLRWTFERSVQCSLVCNKYFTFSEFRFRWDIDHLSQCLLLSPAILRPLPRSREEQKVARLMTRFRAPALYGKSLLGFKCF